MSRRRPQRKINRKRKNADGPYECSRCHVKGGRHLFEARDFARFEKTGTLKCKECYHGRRKGEPCRQPDCSTFVEEKDLTESEKKYRSQGFVCQSCRGNGYSMKDLKTYDCSVCKTTGGRRKFSDLDMNFAYWAAKGKLHCIDCAPQEDVAK